MGITEVDTEIRRRCSSSSKSAVAVPSSTRPSRLVTPVLNSKASVSEVLPAPLWPTRATLRMNSVAYSFMYGFSSGVRVSSGWASSIGTDAPPVNTRRGGNGPGCLLVGGDGHGERRLAPENLPADAYVEAGRAGDVSWHRDVIGAVG